MKNYQLKIHPDTILREKAFPVLNLYGEIFDLLNAMSKIMYTYQGTGLAAAQVGM